LPSSQQTKVDTATNKHLAHTHTYNPTKMETINNMASAAAKAVWGENQGTREPLSGAQGDVAKGEPYDAGNLGM
jgi:hypothetical protein